MKSYKTLIFIIVVIVLLAAVCLFFPSDGVPFLGRRLFFPTLKEVLSPEKSVSVDEKMRALEESIKMQAITDSINTARETARQDSIRFYKKFFSTRLVSICLQTIIRFSTRFSRQWSSARQTVLSSTYYTTVTRR